MYMNQKGFVSYELAVRLKERGFCEPCRFFYSHVDVADGPVSVGGDAHFAEDYNAGEAGGSPIAVSVCSMPSLYAAQKWLREERGIHVDVCVYADYSTDADGKVCDRWDFWGFDLYAVVGGDRIGADDSEYDSYEEALAAGIAAALELIREGE